MRHDPRLSRRAPVCNGAARSSYSADPSLRWTETSAFLAGRTELPGFARSRLQCAGGRRDDDFLDGDPRAGDDLDEKAGDVGWLHHPRRIETSPAGPQRGPEE